MLVLLDRDGVLNEDREDSVKSPEELVMLPESAKAVARLNRIGAKVAVITNQSIVGREIISQETLDEIHKKLLHKVEAVGGHIERIFVCTDAPDQATHRRKPNPGMLLEALEAFGASPEKTPMVGDALIDLQAAQAAGCPRYLVLTGKGHTTYAQGIPQQVHPVTICQHLTDAVDKIIVDSSAQAKTAS